MTILATRRRAAILGSVALAAIGLSSTAFAQKTKLTVYTAIENEQLEPFKKAFEADNPANAAALKPIFKSGKNPETWVGMDAFLAVVCFNTAEAKKGNKPAP